MRAVYFDCYAGAAGNMILASLLDAGADASWVMKQLRRMPLGRWLLKIEQVKKNGIAARHLTILQDRQPERHLSQILDLIDKGRYPLDVSTRIKKIFQSLAKAEAKVHGTSVDRVHFHEVGAVDAVVDIAGTCLALENLGIEKVFCSPLNIGWGRVECAHGILPVPAPATALLLKGAKVFQNELGGELVTPTAAAILTTLSSGFGPMPQMNLKSVGHGAGSRDLQIPNMMRALVGEFQPSFEASLEALVLLETNIDDMNPQVYQHLMDRLFVSGAVDVWMIPIQAKKGRPGVMLSAIIPRAKEAKAVEVIFRETTTGGIRRREVERYCLPRRMITVKTRFGSVRGKLFSLAGGGIKFMPEYEDCLRLAKKNEISLLAVQNEALRSFGEKSN